MPEIEKSFDSLIKAKEITREHILSAIITIDFDLEKTQTSRKVPELELPNYECVSEIIDSIEKYIEKK